MRSLPLPNPILSFGAAAASAWFEKQPEWRHPGGTSVDVCAHEGVVVTKALVYERPRPPQFPLHPYTYRPSLPGVLDRHGIVSNVKLSLENRDLSKVDARGQQNSPGVGNG